MKLSYLTIPEQEAVSKIHELILAGYRLKDRIEIEYAPIATTPEKITLAAKGWETAYGEWIKAALWELDRMYITTVNSHNFRDASPTRVIMGNVKRSYYITNIQSRIDKLNEFDNYIRTHSDITILYAGRDHINVTGDNASVKTKN